MSAFYSPSSHSLSLLATRGGDGGASSRGLIATSSRPLPGLPDTPDFVEEYQAEPVCPTCLRAWGDEEAASEIHRQVFEPSATAPNYFRLLAEGATIDDASSSVATTRPSTPDGLDGSGAGSARLDHDATAPGYCAKFFVEIKRLGRGARGQVFLCQHVLNGNRLGTYAIKKIPCGDRSEHLLQTLREVHMMETLQHPNVIHYQHAWIEETAASAFSPRVPTLHVLMMAANGGSLADWIYARSGARVDSPRPSGTSSPMGNASPSSPLRRNPKAEQLKAAFRRRQKAKEEADGTASSASGSIEPDAPAVHLLNEDEVTSLMHDIASGLGFLHSKGILHLDLKPANVLLHWDEDALIPRVLISDFGSSIFLHESHTRSGHTGTMEFMAPEVLRIDPRTGALEELSRKADMWSLGMILHLLLYFRLPYTQVEDIDVLSQEMRDYQGWKLDSCQLPTPHVKSKLLPLLHDLLQIDPTKRPACDEVVARLDRISHAKAAKRPASKSRASHQAKWDDRLRPPRRLSLLAVEAPVENSEQRLMWKRLDSRAMPLPMVLGLAVVKVRCSGENGPTCK